jgi:RimJ/RimL family protein N-acetyltransferase
MIVCKYGLVLRRLRHEHMELVREKRNSESIRKHMFFQEHITPEMQEKWLQSITTIHHYYFLIEVEGKPVGVVNGKNVDFDKRTSEGGIFIWEEEHRSSFVPVVASVIMAEITFQLFHLKHTTAEVRSDNKAAIQFNAKLGYELIHEEGTKQIYRLTKDRFYAIGKNIIHGVRTVSKEKEPVSWKDFDFSGVDNERILQLYSNFPQDIQQDVNLRINR